MKAADAVTLFSSKRLRVLVVSTNSDQAGAPLHVEAVITQLMTEVDFLAVFGEDGPVVNRLSAKGIRTVVLPEIRSAISPRRDWKALIKLSELVRKFSPDLIHSHSSKAGMLSRLVACRHGLPSIYTVHGWGWRGLSPFNAGLVQMVEKTLKWIPKSRFIYVSQSVADEAKEVLHIAQSQGQVIHNGVPDMQMHVGGTKFKDEHRPPTILMAARVSSAKDHASLVTAFEGLNHDASLILCGSGTESRQFLKQVLYWAPTRYSQIQCLGERSDMADILARSDIFVLTSHFEALPLSIIEAMSASLPVVATDVGGVSELINHGMNGYLVKPSATSEIMLSIRRLLEPEHRREMGANGRMRYEQEFTVPRMCEKIVQQYHSAVSQ
jgi:glycosyltransferase involved in cell wall biosynthesis